MTHADQHADDKGHGAEGHHHANDPDILLTALTALGLAVALVDRFVWPLPVHVPQAGLALAFAAGGIPAAFVALKELFGRGRLDIDLLMVLAAVAAAAVGAALEGAVLLALFSLAGTLEHRAMGRARRAVEALMALRPDTALRLSLGGVEEVAVAVLVVGDRVILRPGARVPWMEWWSKGRDRSMKARSPARLCRWPSLWGTGCMRRRSTCTAS